ncbi:MAG: ribonucleoside-diphosphate reductase, adenosylcobalamin-dependent, partial [Flavobacteriaceae bacterium]|nr:ribonucleoside-diphosphate reductase, adenosylcobalamin-dependent [Flavobacteriaceae bacterium]
MPALSKNALEILRARYFLRNRAGEILETPGKMFRRVANAVATGEDKNKTHWQQRYYAVMNALDFLPNSPTLMNAGLPKGQLSACFVLPVQDSLHSIFDTLKNAALIHQSGGGTGFNFSRLRPKDDQVSSSGGTSSGPIAFMKIFDAATEYVKQGGRRRGANMGILNIDHPDVEEFIESKSDGKQLQNFNISVGITDAFMKALNRDGDWELVNPRTKKVTRKVKAVYLWNLII